MITSHIARPFEGRPARPARTLIWCLPRNEPVSVPVPRVATGVGKTFHAVFEPLALLAVPRGTVLPFLAVGIIPFETAEESILGSVRPRDSRVDEEKDGLWRSKKI